MCLPMLFPPHIGSVSHTTITTMRIVSSPGCFVKPVDGWGLLIYGWGVSVILTSIKWKAVWKSRGYFRRRTYHKLTAMKQYYPSFTFTTRVIMLRWQHGGMVGSLFFNPTSRRVTKNSNGVKPFCQHLWPLIVGGMRE